MAFAIKRAFRRPATRLRAPQIALPGPRINRPQTVRLPISPEQRAVRGGPCTYYVAENGLYATYNTVKPTFSALSITDQWRPSDKLLFSIGLRQDTFKYEGSNTNYGPARDFFFAAWNKDNCINTATGAPADRGLGLPACGPGTTPGANAKCLTNQVSTYTILQPRLGATYTINSDTVLRFSAGKYVEPPNSAYEQYNTLQNDLPAFLGTAFYKFGFTRPDTPSFRQSRTTTTSRTNAI